jgi:penicillin-binding protein 2
MPLVDWHEIVDEQAGHEPVVASRHRVRWLVATFGLALAVILGRAVQLEVSDGATFRRLAGRPIERQVSLPARRGRILARDGTVLAADRQATALAIQFRYLQSPPNADWLRRRAKARLSAAERRDPACVRMMEGQIRTELEEMHRRLARVCDVPLATWQARLERIDRRVTALAERVNAARLERHRRQAAIASADDDVSLKSALAGLFAPPEPLPPPPVIVVEQTVHHRVVDDLPPRVAEEIRMHPQRYPGVTVVEHTCRDYPLASLAAHTVGHVGRAEVTGSLALNHELDDDVEAVVGLLGIERTCEVRLAGTRGQAVQATDRRGRILTTVTCREPAAGQDVVLTIDPALQRTAETWLDHVARRAASRSQPATDSATPGAAAVVVDVHSGEILAAASSPRFDPNLFAAGDPRVDAALRDAGRPMFDRVVRMALPPGSVFKALTAIALVSDQAIDPRETFHCQGYLDDPERLRCQIFRAKGVGHGDLTLADALAQSCNVYFFHHVARLGGPRLVDWAARFGFGRPSGIELPDEAAGELPTAQQLQRRHQAQFLAVGQGAITATPLQVARLYAAIANGGHLITPRILRDQPATLHRPPTPAALSQDQRVRGLSEEALSEVRQGLVRVVAHPRGTAFATVQLPGVAIAGKTGTAETGAATDHSWFAGYVPADKPRYAFVVVFEHAGSGAEIAGPVARRLVERMHQLGYFGPSETAAKPIPPGKG